MATSPPFPMLPSAPLAKVVEAFQYRHPMESLCESVGISDRTFRDWRDGSRPTAKFDTADMVLIRLGLCWWEVWNEETTRRYGLIATTWSWRMSSGRNRIRKRRREPIAIRRYWDLGPDLEALKLVAYAFTGERAGEQLEMAA